MFNDLPPSCKGHTFGPAILSDPDLVRLFQDFDVCIDLVRLAVAVEALFDDVRLSPWAVRQEGENLVLVRRQSPEDETAESSAYLQSALGAVRCSARMWSASSSKAYSSASRTTCASAREVTAPSNPGWPSDSPS
jgi:hypothetical protein